MSNKRERYDGLGELLREYGDFSVPFNRIEKAMLIIAGLCVLAALYLLVGLYI